MQAGVQGHRSNPIGACHEVSVGATGCQRPGK
jgi:hypothetical protein